MPKITRCAACKSLRRGCAQDCIFAPYFPANNPQRYDCVHRIFGANNVAKSLQDLPVHQRSIAADCMSIEASWRIADPVYGCTGFISQLQDQIIKAQSELAQVQAQLALYNAQIQHNVNIPYAAQEIVQVQPSSVNDDGFPGQNYEEPLIFDNNVKY